VCNPGPPDCSTADKCKLWMSASFCHALADGQRTRRQDSIQKRAPEARARPEGRSATAHSLDGRCDNRSTYSRYRHPAVHACFQKRILHPCVYWLVVYWLVASLIDRRKLLANPHNFMCLVFLEAAHQCVPVAVIFQLKRQYIQLTASRVIVYSTQYTATSR
jgi:hypothetical protein